MSSSKHNNYKKVLITIDIDGHKKVHIKETRKKMNANKKYQTDDRITSMKYICSVCLNNISFDDRNVVAEKKSKKLCPVCSPNDTKNKKKYRDNEKFKSRKINAPCSKTVQTDQADLTQSLTLLNEVLTVFQSKKNSENSTPKSRRKVVVLKDVSVCTEMPMSSKRTSISNLCCSEIFQVSIDEENRFRDNKFTIVCSFQPEVLNKSLFSINIKPKSSSIPLMKMEEIKNCLKEKVKCKDTIEEVNRMFATVRRTEQKDIGASESKTNRPLTRTGPRVLPVVKTYFCNNNNNISSHSSEESRKFRAEGKCDKTDYLLSSGDSSRNIKDRLLNNTEEEVRNCMYVSSKLYTHVCTCCGGNE